MSVYACASDQRRQLLLQQSTLNGVDFIESSTDASFAELPARIRVMFVHPLAILPDLSQVTLRGGDPLRRLQITSVNAGVDSRELLVDVEGRWDLSAWTLSIVSGPHDPAPPPWLDPALASATFRFAPQCEDGPCREEHCHDTVLTAGPRVDRLARDWESVRAMMLDRLSLLQPDWTEHHVADVRTTLVEVVAALADHAAYRQDVVATESYLGTARRRISVRRHARLMDYMMSDGTNARVWVHFDAHESVLVRGTDTEPVVPEGTALLTGGPEAPAAVERGSSTDQGLQGAGALQFEVLSPLRSLVGTDSRMTFHTWAGSKCCLPTGSVAATLAGHHPHLLPGSIVVLTEHLDPVGPAHTAADADPTHRHPVRLTAVRAFTGTAPRTDPLTGDKITDIEWDAQDALPFPLTVSLETRTPEGGTAVRNDAAVALGNVVLADHGATHRDINLGPARPRRPELMLPDRPITQKPLVKILGDDHDREHFAPYDPTSSASRWIVSAPDTVLAAVTLHDPDGPWQVRPDLLSSGPARDIVVDVDDEGDAYIRFGREWPGMDPDGASPQEGTPLTATFRVGNGTAGNVGVNTVRSLLLDGSSPTALTNAVRPTPVIPVPVRVWNPLPGRGGTDPESIEEVRRRAPQAFGQQKRAVTDEDYAQWAEATGLPERRLVQRAVASTRWTGSWYCVIVAVDFLGDTEADPSLLNAVATHLDEYRMSGYDVQVVAALYVPLEVRFHVTVHPRHRRDLVAEALEDLMSSQRLSDGTIGLFHPDRLTFGRDVYLGPLIAAAQSVPGVQCVEATAFRRYRQPGTDARATGRLPVAPSEIARLDNDPSRPSRGIFRIDRLEGGR
ncbi:putative baseplate assembly protein [Arthrobacter sp. B0490]|uniref:putative baseplate assembly protein n=1 Tax=Arthrobacter sp. B0490 TaxID=2058891 RepID=UPI000CE5590D|nr:putative baseplate assembly protein [Arthrobacter sp. B0490]